MNRLERLVQVSSDLRDALLSRDPARIMDIVEQQNDLSDFVQMAAAGGAPENLSDDPEMAGVVSRLTRLQQANRLLSSAFLSIYRSTLRAGGASGSPDPGLYGRSGALMPLVASSMLIQQTG